jgi:tRNA dimethylallyltransferase
MSAAPAIIAIVGATATGKTDIGEAVADVIGGEIVCADSRQVFRELEIGTGKPDPSTRAACPHHLFEALSIGEPASAGWYARVAGEACAVIHGRGRIPVLVGGSGFYVRAAQHGLAEIPETHPEVRARWQQRVLEEGPARLHEALQAVDPETAARLHPQDVQRVVRALEVFEGTGHSLSWWHRQPHEPRVRGAWRVFEITAPAGRLKARIERRTCWMFEAGLLEETRALLASGRASALRALTAIGYDEAAACIEGSLERDAAEARTSLRTLQLAKRQRTWFRHQSDILSISGEESPVAQILRDLANRTGPSRAS